MPKPTPYLNALRAFESAARYESFTKASVELNVSQTVVSQHIKRLEDWLGTKLFVRFGNRVELTEQGRLFAPTIAEAFQLIRDSCSDLRSKKRVQKLTVAAEPALASRWLRRQLSDFHKLNPHVTVDLQSSRSPLNLRGNTIDAVVHFERRLTGFVGKKERLLPLDGYPVCSPKLLERLNLTEQTKTDIRTLPLVHDNGKTIWRLWFQAHAPESDNWEEGTVYSDLSLALDATLDGEGVLLGNDVFCAREIEAGNLIKLSDQSIRCTWYSLATEEIGNASPALSAFCCWLKDTAENAV